MSKSLPGSMPSAFSFSTIGASAGAGGLSFISRASRPKKAPASIFCTCPAGGVFVSTPAATGTSAGGVYGWPQAESGVSLYCFCSAFTAS